MRTQHWPVERVWDASCQIHKKKKKTGGEINIFSPIGFTLQLPKKKRKKEAVTANNCRFLLTQVTHTKEKYKGNTRTGNIYAEATMQVNKIQLEEREKKACWSLDTKFYDSC